MEIDRYMREEMPNGSTDENGTFVAHYNVSIMSQSSISMLHQIVFVLKVIFLGP